MSLLFTTLERNTNHTSRGTLLGFLILWYFDRLNVISSYAISTYAVSTAVFSTYYTFNRLQFQPHAISTACNFNRLSFQPILISSRSLRSLRPS